MTESKHQESPRLCTPSRFITDHDASGLGVFNTSISELLPADVKGNMVFHLGYATTTSPTDFTNQSDIVTYSYLLSNPPGIYIPGGTVMRTVDFGPGCETPMHRTASLDYGVVLEGEIELILDSEESRVMKRGDISIQRGTDHRWKNRSQTEWGRMLFVAHDAKPLEINGKVLEQEQVNYALENGKPSGA
jgi:quercetin dioxygenase-like cupin family protein